MLMVVPVDLQAIIIMLSDQPGFRRLHHQAVKRGRRRAGWCLRRTNAIEIVSRQERTTPSQTRGSQWRASRCVACLLNIRPRAAAAGLSASAALLVWFEVCRPRNRSIDAGGL
jgi:hypothetical protein